MADWTRDVIRDVLGWLRLGALAAVAPTAHAATPERIALVIGNGAYQTAALRNPANDARAVAGMLEGMGFEVAPVRDATRVQMHRAVRDFGRKLRGGSVGLFYFAGHGVQADGRNFLVPVDVDIQEEDEVRFSSLDAEQVLAKMESAGNGLNIVFLDACRDNPFAGSRSGNRGLAVVRAPRGSIISYAAAPGKTAADGKGQHSPYTTHLLDVLPTPGLTVERALKEVRKRVAAETGNGQIPWTHESMLQDFYFVERAAAPPVRELAALPTGPKAGSGFSLDDLQGQASKEEALRGGPRSARP